MASGERGGACCVKVIWERKEGENTEANYGLYAVPVCCACGCCCPFFACQSLTAALIASSASMLLVPQTKRTTSGEVRNLEGGAKCAPSKYTLREAALPAVELDWGKLQVRRDVRVLDVEALIHALALEPLRRDGAGSDGGAAAESAELRVNDLAALVHLFHRVQQPDPNASNLSSLCSRFRVAFVHQTVP